MSRHQTARIHYRGKRGTVTMHVCGRVTGASSPIRRRVTCEHCLKFIERRQKEERVRARKRLAAT